MDHLPTPAEPAFPAPKIPWLGLMYDGRGFHRYPERMGWERVNHNGMFYLLRGDELEGNKEFEMAFHQAWLWKTLLVEVLRTYDVVTNFSDFTTPRLNTKEPLPEGTVIYLTTEHLPAYLEEMAARDRLFPLRERKDRLAAVLTILGMAFDFAECAASADGLHSSALSDEIALSVLVLGQTLQNAIRSMAEDLFDENAEGMLQDMETALKGFSQLKSKFLRIRLQNAGWCKSDVKLFEAYLDVENLYYASMLQRNGLVKDHSGCSDDTCLAHQLVEGSYETRHTNPDCKCGYVGVDIASVDRILQDGGVPAVNISGEANARLKVVNVTADSLPYISISHVWSDGLGNERANSLPKCQLQRLREMCSKIPIAKHHTEVISNVDEDANALSGSQMPIWIDTLCVPLSPNRQLALEAIGRTFQQAEVVLVVDLELTNASLNTRWQELCLRVGMSGWSRRLWTLQEAALARDRLYFQFKEGALDLWSKTLESLAESSRQRSFRSKSDEATMVFLRCRAKPHFEGESDLFTFIWMAKCLLFRRTSKQKDEAFCLASTLDLDVSRILRFATVEERMREFLRMLPVIPSTVFFLQGAKLQFPGYRWAPRTFLEPKSNPSSRWRGEETTRMAQWDESGRGVRVGLPGFLITFTKALLPEDEERGLSVWVKKPTTLAESFLVELRHKDYWRQICGLEKMILIVENDMTLPLGFLAYPRGEESNVAFVDYICPVHITPVKEMINWEAIDHAGHYWQAECTVEYGDDQDWCIG
jgi:hypothetical protein